MEGWKLGYLAGMIDGEGNISIFKALAPSRNLTFRPSIRIGNTNCDSLQFLQTEFGGTLYLTPKQFGKDAYILSWYGTKAQELLKLISDKLIIKKKQALLFISFPLSPTNRKQIAKEEQILRESIYLQIKELNKRNVLEVTFTDVEEPLLDTD